VYFAGKKTFTDAGADCAAQNMHLATVKTSTANAAIQGMVVGSDVFLGATDTVTEGVFLWSDGTGLTFKNFNAGEPNNGAGGGQEDCLIILGAKGGLWDDRPCGTPLGYVCEL
jgi:hypothetical protein